MDLFLLYIFPAFLILAIVFLIYFSSNRSSKKQKSILTWPKIDGVVLRSEIEERTSRKTRNGRTYTHTYLMPRIEYKYEILGDAYEANEYKYWSWGTFPNYQQDELEQIISNYPIGKIVSVTYNPEKPSEAYLLVEPSVDHNKRNKVIMLSCIVLALFWVIFGLLNNTKESTPKTSSQSNNFDNTGEQFIASSNIIAEQWRLTCTDEVYGGIKYSYIDHHCVSNDSDVESVEIFIREKNTKKVDMVSAEYETRDGEGNIQYFSDIAGLVFTGDDLQSVIAWINSSLPAIKTAGDHASTTINDIDLNFDLIGEIIRFNIGHLK